MALDDKTREEILALERKYWDAMRDKDSAAAASLTDEPCLIVGVQGAREIGKAALAGMVESAAFQVKEYELGEATFRELADGVVAVAYKVNERLTTEGRDVELEAYDASVWLRKEGGWVCALHTESLVGDPFGRR